jgi:glycosyltransferase involved in cell wall biosynthesis
MPATAPSNLPSLSLSGPPSVSRPPALQAFPPRQEGRFVYLHEALLPAHPDEDLDNHLLNRTVQLVAEALQPFSPFYAHFGGAGDALLLLATFLDEHPEATVVSYPNSLPAAQSFFEAFPSLARVVFLPPRASAKVHLLLRMLLRRLPGCHGMGITPDIDYFKEWHAGLDLFKTYRVNPHPQWPGRFCKNPCANQVAVAPKGSLSGMIGTKRNVIEPNLWSELLGLLREAGLQPVILGTPEERAEYPSLDGCQDRRSYSFSEQMRHIAESVLFVGADSWGKTFAALASIPTIVFEAIKRGDWLGRTDPSDHVFLRPWPAIKTVKNLAECRAVLASQGRLKSQVAEPEPIDVFWQGSFRDPGSLAHVNRELSRELESRSGFRLCREDLRSAPAPAAATPKPRSSERSITLRHLWPPNWEPVLNGHLVIIQPWEFGALPEQWVRQARHVDEFWVPSNYVRQLYLDSGISAEKVHVVPNGIDPTRFRPEAPPLALPTRKTFKFLFVGGTIPRKGPDLLLEAYLQTFTAAEDVCLVIKDFGGDGVYAGQTLQTRIRAASAQPGAPEILHLTGELPADEMPGLYNACDCLVHPYRGEGFALPVLEAMACGLPVIVTDGGATDDFAPPALARHLPATRREIGFEVAGMKLACAGWLLEPDPVVLAQEMRWAFSHRDEARTLGRQASASVRRDWTWACAACRAAERLQTLAARRKTTAPCASLSKPAALPEVAKLGSLAEARARFTERRFLEAWRETLTALQVRPFHPEACLLLAEIALGAGDSITARQCAERARRLVPEWKPARQFLKSALKGSAKWAWPELSSLLAPPPPPRLSVCLIARNEEAFLGQCLDSIRGLGAQIIVVDTGSTDRTVEIARQHGAEIHSFAWCDDFSAARNAALAHATGDWILVLDADEELPPASHPALLKAMRKAEVMAWRLPILDAGREEEGGTYVPRLFRNAPGLYFAGRIHEHAFGSVEVLRKAWGLDNRLGAASLLHHGYTKELTKNRSKIDRNLRLLQRALEESPRDPSLLMSHGLELVRSGDWLGGLDQYIAAYRILAALPPAQVPPELREMLLTQLCTHLMAVKNFEEIIHILNSPLAQASRLTASMHFALGLAHIQLGHFSEGAAHMQHCLAQRGQPSLAPVNKTIHTASPHHCLAICLARLNRHAEADAAFAAGLKEDAPSPQLRLDFAAFRAGQGRAREALEQLYQLLLERPAEEPAWQLGGQIALSQPEFLEVAQTWTAEAHRLCPHNTVILAQRAETLLLSGDASSALPLWRQLASNRQPQALAAQALCELVGSEAPPMTPEVTEETAISQAFLGWYRRLLSIGARDILLQINARLTYLAQSLPSAARLLTSAVTEAQAV